MVIIMIERGIVKALKDNHRYIPVSCQSGNYLIDVDRCFLGHIYPVLNWILPVSALVLPQEINSYLIQGEHEDQKSGMGNIVGTISVLLLSNFLTLIFTGFIFDDVGIEQVRLILLWSIAILIVYRIYLSMTWKSRMSRYVDLKSLSSIKIFIRPTWFQGIVATIVGPFVVVGMAISGIYMLYDGAIGAGLFVYFGFGFLASMMSRASFHVTDLDEGERYYNIIFMNQQHIEQELPHSRISALAENERIGRRKV